MTFSIDTILGLSARFTVEVDQVNLGGWGKCTGLAVEFVSIPWEEGGNYDYQPILPDKIKYSPVTLKRAMSKDESAQVQRWLASKVGSYMNASSSGGGGTAKITLCDPHGIPVASWRLRGVYPSKWEGPELDGSSGGIAMETLVLVHEGFL